MLQWRVLTVDILKELRVRLAIWWRPNSFPQWPLEVLQQNNPMGSKSICPIDSNTK